MENDRAIWILCIILNIISYYWTADCKFDFVVDLLTRRTWGVDSVCGVRGVMEKQWILRGISRHRMRLLNSSDFFWDQFDVGSDINR